MTAVTVFRDKFRVSWPERTKPWTPEDWGYVVALGAALERTYRTDAHFTAYAADRRLNSDALGQGVPVTMTCIVFDVDCPEVHGTSQPAPEAWRVTRRKRILDMEREHPGVYGYDTRGGLRFLWRLPAPEVLRTRDDAVRWSQDYAICAAYFARRYDVHVDPACGDWQRHYRLPHATRERHGKPERRPIWGDPDNIGTLVIEATHDDMATAKRLTKSFRERKILKFDRSDRAGGDGRGLLWHLLAQRGDIDRDRPDGTWIVRCPNESQHTAGSTGDSSTILYPPAVGKELGAICCLHAHCQGLTVADWLRMFRDEEIARARAAAGLPPQTKGRAA